MGDWFYGAYWKTNTQNNNMNAQTGKYSEQQFKYINKYTNNPYNDIIAYSISTYGCQTSDGNEYITSHKCTP